MKKISCLLMAFTLCLLLCACSNTMPYDKANELYPWLFGEWGSSDLFSQEVLIEIRNDGTCVFKGEQGTWTIPKEWDGMQKAPLDIELENGEKYWSEFVIDGDIYYLIICNDKEGIEAYNGEIRKLGIPMEIPEEYTPIMGVWADIPNTFADISEWNEILEIREDGSCSILGEEGLWIPQNYYSSMEDSGKAEHYELLAKVSDSIFTISIYDPAHTNFHSLSVWDENYNQVAEASINLSSTEVIDITAENVLDYFEIKEYSVWEKDAFGDFTRLVVAQYLEIKPQYAEAVYLMNEQITAEIECDIENCIIAVEPALKEWTILSSEAVGKESVIVNFMEVHSAEAGDSFGALIDRFNHTYDEEECGGHGHTSSINIVRAVGKLYLDSTKIQQESTSN